MKPPCKKNGVDCPDRHPGCQTNCQKLIPLHEHYERIRRARAESDIYLSYIVPIVTKNREK